MFPSHLERELKQRPFNQKYQQPSCVSPETLTESKITEWDLKIAQKNLNKKQNQAAVRIYFMKDFRFIINGDFL